MSPDGEHFTFKRHRVLHLGKLSGSTPKRLQTHTGETFKSARWSPDGKRLLSVVGPHDHGRAYILDPLSGEGEMIQEDVSTAYWSSDGKRIVFASFREMAQAKFYVMNEDGTEVRYLTEGGGRVFWQDGRLVFSRERVPSTITQLTLSRKTARN